MRYLLVCMLVMVSGCGNKFAMNPDVTAYFAALCEKDGFAKGSSENTGCIRVKAVQAAPMQVRSGGSNRMSTTCTKIGNDTHCN